MSGIEVNNTAGVCFYRLSPGAWHLLQNQVALLVARIVSACLFTLAFVVVLRVDSFDGIGSGSGGCEKING